MTTHTQALTSRRALDRPLWLALRCALGWHLPATYELKTFDMSRKEGRKVVEFTIMANVQEAICCGKTLDFERVL